MCQLDFKNWTQSQNIAQCRILTQFRAKIDVMKELKEFVFDQR